MESSATGDAVDLAPLGTLGTAWQTTLDGAMYGQPLVVGGQILAATENVLYALAPADGSVRGQLNLGTVPHFTSPTLSGDHAYVGTMTGVVAVSGA
ncbi:hypothetical protein GCM10027360_56210 [Amycolatopsis echigonensis]